MISKKTVIEKDGLVARQALQCEVFDLIANEDLRDHIPLDVLETFIRDAREALKKK